MQPHDEQVHEESPESVMSHEVFGVLGMMATAQVLSGDPKIRARVRSTVARGFLPLALGVLLGGLIGARLGGSLGWLAGIVIGLFIGMRFSAPR